VSLGNQRTHLQVSNISVLEDDTTALSQNGGNWLLSDMAPCSIRIKSSATLRENLKTCTLFLITHIRTTQNTFPFQNDNHENDLNTLRTGDANLRFLRFCITTVKDEWLKSAFLTRAWFPCTSLHNTWSVSPNGPPGWMFKETWPHSELMIYDKYRGKNTHPQCVNGHNQSFARRVENNRKFKLKYMETIGS
jgi:hypothetical protein